MNSLTKRFIKYITVSTDSNPDSNVCPSSESQWDLSKIIVEDLENNCLEDITNIEQADAKLLYTIVLKNKYTKIPDFTIVLKSFCALLRKTS